MSSDADTYTGGVQRVYDFVVAAGSGFSIAGAIIMAIYGLWAVVAVLAVGAVFLARCYQRDLIPGTEQ